MAHIPNRYCVWHVAYLLSRRVRVGPRAKQRHTNRVREKAPCILPDMATSLTVDGNKSETAHGHRTKGPAQRRQLQYLARPSPLISMLVLESLTRRFAVSPFFPFASRPAPAATLRSGGEGGDDDPTAATNRDGRRMQKSFTFISIYGIDRCCSGTRP